MGILLPVVFVIIVVLLQAGLSWHRHQTEKIKRLENENAVLSGDLVDQKAKLCGLIHERHPRPQTEDRFSPLKADELLTAFAVGDDEPLLEAIVHVVHAMEIERGDNASIVDLDPATAKAYAVASGALKDAQEEILDWVDRANKAKRNEKA